MENFINTDDLASSDRGDNLSKVLIATLYNADPVLLAANRLGPDRLVLLIDDKPVKEQKDALKLIEDSLGRVIEVETVKTPVYDIVAVASKAVWVIDNQDKDDVIYVNVTAGRKTKAMGLLYAAYCRIGKVKKIAYNPEEDRKSVIYLPKLSFRLTKKQTEILDLIESGEFKTPMEMADKVEMSRAMLYRNIEELRVLGYIETDEGYKLTDAGKIARL